MKKKYLIIVIIICILLALLIPSGFNKRTDVALTDFEVLENGTKIKLKVMVTSSMGYTRTLHIKQGGDNKYITFYSTFGGSNSKIGAKNEFEITVNELCEEIYFYSGDGGYKKVLQKTNGVWEMNYEKELVGSTYNNPIVPEGFKKVETETARWELDENGIPKGWNHGLVIEDENGNQFVWVPVQKDVVNFKEEIENLMDEESEEEIYQIKKYGGFYIARFEAGVSNNMQNVFENISSQTNDIEDIPTSKSGQIPWNFISLENAKKNAQSMYNTENLKSDLITTRQWLKTVDWIKESGYDFEDMKELGNFADSFFQFSGLYSDDRGVTFKKGQNATKVKNYLLATGINESAKTNNIYDLFGNVMEFTDGYVEYRGYYSVGGYYTETATLKTTYLLGVEPLDKLGFRVVLYME